MFARHDVHGQGHEQGIVGTASRWHTKLPVSFSCRRRGKDNSTGATGPGTLVPGHCEPRKHPSYPANKFAQSGWLG